LEEVKVGPSPPEEASAPIFNVWTKFKEVWKQINKATVKCISEAPIAKKALTEMTSMTSDIYYYLNPMFMPFKLTFNPPVSGAFNLSID
jgi:hypothetical protein